MTAVGTALIKRVKRGPDRKNKRAYRKKRPLNAAANC